MIFKGILCRVQKVTTSPCDGVIVTYFDDRTFPQPYCSIRSVEYGYIDGSGPSVAELETGKPKRVWSPRQVFLGPSLRGSRLNHVPV